MTHRGDGIGRRAHPDQPCILHRSGEACILSEEPKSWMDGVGPDTLGSINDGLDAEVVVDTDSDIAGARVEGSAIRIRVDGDRLNTQSRCSRCDSNRDLAPVRDEQLRDQCLNTPQLVVPSTGAE